MSQQSIINFSLRFNPDLHEQLKKLAEQDKRSLHNYIITTLENHVNKKDTN